MFGSDEEDAQARALKARKNLKRLAKAVEFEAFEDADLRREEEQHKLAPQGNKPTARPGTSEASLSAGRRKGIPSQRGT